LQYALTFHLVGSFLSLDPRISAIHVILPGCRVVLLFCNAIVSSKGSGILAECISCDCFIFTKIECYGYHGLDLEFSSYAHAHNEWLMLIVTDLAPNSIRVSLTMGGCWILFKCTGTSVAPTSSEQPKPGHIWLSPPPIKKSMMHITKSETLLIFITMVSSSVVFCDALPPFWTKYILSMYVILMNYLINLPIISCQGMCKGYD